VRRTHHSYRGVLQSVECRGVIMKVQVEVSTSNSSLVQRSSAECRVSGCDHEGSGRSLYVELITRTEEFCRVWGVEV